MEVLYPRSAFASMGVGTVEQPVVIDTFPFNAKGPASERLQNRLEHYSCLPDFQGQGKEVVYSFSQLAPAKLTVILQSETSSQLHIFVLSSLRIDDSQQMAEECMAHGSGIVEVELKNVGQYYLVVDGPEPVPAFVLRSYAIGDSWQEVAIGEGVVWRARRYQDIAGGPQVVSEIVADLSVSGVRFEANLASEPVHVPAYATLQPTRPLAGTNPGAFRHFMKSGGALKMAHKADNRATFGLTQDHVPMSKRLAAGVDWPEVWEGAGGLGLLVSTGIIHSGISYWMEENFSNTSFAGPHPRTVVGADAQGRVHLIAVDGRRTTAHGMSLDDLAAWTASSEVGLTEAVSLDGGGSTIIWVDGMTPTGVVNYPYSNDGKGEEEASHQEAPRRVPGALFVYGKPFNHPPRFQTIPPAQAERGKPYRYDSSAIDLDVDDELTYLLLQAPQAMTVGPSTGVIEYLPGEGDSGQLQVTLAAKDNHGKQTEQSFEIVVIGGVSDEDAGQGRDGGNQDTKEHVDEPSGFTGSGCMHSPNEFCNSGILDCVVAVLLLARFIRIRTKTLGPPPV